MTLAEANVVSTPILVTSDHTDIFTKTDAFWFRDGVSKIFDSSGTSCRVV